jgi:hypothetical protein
VVLETLTRIGVVLAEALERRVVDAVQAGPIDGALALDYSRVSRALRQTLAARLDLDRGALTGQFEAERRARREAHEAARRERLNAHKDTAAMAVEEAIHDLSAGTSRGPCGWSIGSASGWRSPAKRTT